MSGFQVDTDALAGVGRGYADVVGQLRDLLGGLDAQVGTLGDAMGIGGATAAYDQMWGAWRASLHGLATELDGQVVKLLGAIASYDMSDNYDSFTDVRERVELSDP